MEPRREDNCNVRDRNFLGKESMYKRDIVDVAV
jgi:hypothetical protein